MSGTIGGRWKGSAAAPVSRPRLPPVTELDDGPCPDGAWNALASGPTGVQAMCSGGAGLGKIYAVSSDGSFASYDITGDAWTTGLATAPFSTADRGGLYYQSSVGEEVWAFYTDNSGTATTYGYDVTGDAWTSYTPMPTPRQGFALANADSRIRLVGGSTPPSFTPTTEHEFYNPDTDTWDTAAPLPAAVVYGAMVTWTGGMYLFGNTPNRAFFWDSGDDAWTEVAPPPWSDSGDFALAGTPFGGGGILVGTEETGHFWIYVPDDDIYLAVDPVGFSSAEAFVTAPAPSPAVNGLYVSDASNGDLSVFTC